MYSKLMKVLGAFIFCILSFSGSAQVSPILSFDGTNDWVNLGNAGDNIRTFEMWFSPARDITDATATTQTLIARETAGANNREEFDLYFWNGTGNLQFLYREDVAPNTPHVIQSNSNSWTADQWYHVAVVMHPTNEITMFIDGVLQTATDPTWTGSTIAIPGTMADDYTALGRWGDFAGRYFEGRMEDVRLSTNARYAADFTPPCPTLTNDGTTAGLWNFNTGSGTTAIDASTSGFDGQINGATWAEDVICEDTQGCTCTAQFDYSTTALPANGNQSVSLNINTMGEEVTSICIELPFYVSLVDPACLACDTENMGANGTILSGSALAGVAGTLDDPYSLGYGRKICYDFGVPTAVNGSITLDLKFPAVLELQCCENRVNYCLDVEIRKADCTVCEYEICPSGSGSDGLKVEDSNPISTESPSASALAPQTDSELLVYPNPSNGTVNVQIKDEKFENGTVTLISLDGQTVVSKQVNTSRFEMDLNAVSRGTYLITVQSGNQTTSQRIVLN